METTVKLPCPIPTMEGVTVEFNMMASRNQVNQFIASKGEERDNVIVGVEGWDSDAWSDDPFGEDAPMAFHAWIIGHAVRDAIINYGTDPNLRTGSSRSMKRTNGARS